MPSDADDWAGFKLLGRYLLGIGLSVAAIWAVGMLAHIALRILAVGWEYGS